MQGKGLNILDRKDTQDILWGQKKPLVWVSVHTNRQKMSFWLRLHTFTFLASLERERGTAVYQFGNTSSFSYGHWSQTILSSVGTWLGDCSKHFPSTAVNARAHSVPVSLVIVTKVLMMSRWLLQTLVDRPSLQNSGEHQEKKRDIWRVRFMPDRKKEEEKI